MADLSLAYEAILNQGYPEVVGYPRAISLGISFLDTIVDQLPRRNERSAAVSYRHHCYDMVNQRLDLIVSQLASVMSQ